MYIRADSAENYTTVLGWSPHPAPSAGRGPKAEGANLGRHLVPYHVKQGESNLASSLYIYLFIYLFILGRGPKQAASFRFCFLLHT